MHVYIEMSILQTNRHRDKRRTSSIRDLRHLKHSVLGNLYHTTAK